MREVVNTHKQLLQGYKPSRLVNLTSRHGSLTLAALVLPLFAGTPSPSSAPPRRSAGLISCESAEGGAREEPGTRQHAQAALGRYGRGAASKFEAALC